MPHLMPDQLTPLPPPPRSRRRLWLGALALGLTAVLSGCGFALRTAPRYAFQSLRIDGRQDTPVVRELRAALDAAGLVVLGAQPAGSGQPANDRVQVVLTVLSDQREKSVVGLTAAGQVRELQLRNRFKFRLTTPAGLALLPDTELLLARDISYTETAALAKEAEEAMLYRDMQSDIVQQVMRRLAAVKHL